MIDIYLSGTSATPLYRQIVEQVKQLVATNTLQPGEHLPTVRQLARHLQINPGTVSRAYSELERQGVVMSRRGGGTIVTADTQDPRLIALRQRQLSNMLSNSILDALSLSGQRGILHAGWAGIGGRDLPDNVFRIEYAPYGWLFPRMAAVIHHGGSGTTAYGVRSGIPSLIVPFVFDQFYWGRRIAALGVGPRAIPFKRLSAERLAEAIGAMVNDTGMRRKAAELGERVRGEGGVAAAVELVEQFARSW